MSDNAEIHSKVLAFLAGEFARKDGRQCVGVDLMYAPGNGFRDDEVRKWVRQDEPELFDNLVNIEKLVSEIVRIAEDEANAKQAGKHRFVVRTIQHLGGRAIQSFSLSPRYNGADETALMTSGVGGAGGRPDVIAGHAGQLMRINAQMFDGVIRVLGQQNASLQGQVNVLTAENATMRVELEDARSKKLEREFQISMAMDKNERANAGFQTLLQIGAVVAAKIGAGDAAQTEAGNPLAMLIGQFGKSLRPEQVGVFMNTLDMAQKMMFMEIMQMVSPPEGGSKSGAKPGEARLGGSLSGGPNGVPS